MKRAILLTGGTQIAIQAIGLLTGVLVTRWLGPDGRGQLAAIIGWASMIAYLGNFGLPVALTYAAARNPAGRHQLLGNSAAFALLQWLALGMIGWLVLPVLLAKHSSELGHLAVLFLWIYLPLNLLTLYTSAILQGSGTYARFNAVRVSVPLMYAVLLLVFWTMHRITVVSVVSINILSNVVALTLALTLALPSLRRLSVGSSIKWLQLKNLRGNLRYGLSAQIGTLQPFSGMQLDVLALSSLVTTHGLGLYMAALAGANLIRAQGYAVGQVVLPEVARMDDAVQQWRIIRRSMILMGLAGAVGFLVVMIAAQPLLVIIYGGDFAQASSMLKILVAAGVVGAVYRILADGLRGMGKPGVSTIAELAGLVAGIAGLALLIPLQGEAGAAWAVLWASAVSLAVAIGLAKWHRTGSSSSSVTRAAEINP
ncbi:MAG: lipopolysaccharide biosynthesis protein [Metallibacterium sp.]